MLAWDLVVGTGPDYLVEVVLLHLIHSIRDLLGFGVIIGFDLLDAWGIPVKVGIVGGSGGKGAFGGVVALG